MLRLSAIAICLALAAALLFVACDDDGEEAPAETPTATSGAPTATSEQPATPSPGTTPGGTPAFEGTRGPVEKAGAVAPPMPLLMEVRAAQHEGYDRITFEFEGERPGYLVGYVQPPITKDPSDLPVEIAGSAFLKIRLESAAAHDDAGQQTVDFTELTPGLPNLIEAEQIGDFEGVVTWLLGLNAEVNFRVGELTNETRIYIDVLHP